MRLWVVVAALLATAPAGAGDVGRYSLSSHGDGAPFVLDTATGRIWRYDRTDDAWYVYDLEALAGQGRKPSRPEPAVPAGEPSKPDASGPLP